MPAKPKPVVRPRPPPPPRPKYTADVNPLRSSGGRKSASASGDDFTPLPLLGAVAVGAFFLKITSAPPPPPSNGGPLVPVLAVTALAGLAAFVLTGDDAPTPATAPTPVPVPKDAAPADAPADAAADAPAPAAEADAAEPAAKTEEAPAM